MDVVTASSDENKEKDDEERGIGAWYSRQLAKLPVAVAMCVLIALITAVCGTISLVVYDPPDFDNPIKGFEARGTVLSAGRLSFFNLGTSTSVSSFYINNGSAYSSSEGVSVDGATNDGGKRRKRSVAGTNIQFFPIRPDYQPAIVFKAVSDTGLFSRKALLSICTQYDDHIGNSPAMKNGCYKITNDACADSWSLGNYVAFMNNRTSCYNMQEDDVSNVQNILETCATYYTSNYLKHCYMNIASCPSDVPSQCVSFNHAVYFIFHYLVPHAFASKADSGNFNLESTILFLPSMYPYRAEIYETTIKGSDINDGVTKVVALGFGSLKFELFSEFLLSDTLYIALGAVLVIAIIWMYTGSLFITLMTLVSMLMSLVLAYFAFVVLFNLPFFPFCNIACAVLIVGVGADDTFVFYDIWCQTEAAKPAGSSRSWILRQTLRHASVTMFVTSCTTASALYTSAVSYITAVKCFAVYGGTAIIVNFLLTLTWLPAVVVIHSHFQSWCSRRMSESGCTEKFAKVSAVFASLNRTFLLLLRKLVFKFWFVWIIVLASLGAGAFCIVYITPTLQLPNVAEFQVFRQSDLFEQYDIVYKTKFDFNIDQRDPLVMYVVFGVRAVDNGNHWNPDDRGELYLEPGFDMSSPEAQVWLRDFCESLRNQSFHRPATTSESCLINIFQRQMELPCPSGNESTQTSCCGQTSFPYPHQLVEECLAKFRLCNSAQGPCANVVIPGPVFDKIDGSVKAFYMREVSSVMDTLDYKEIDEFWSTTNLWIEEKLKTKPAGLTGGWLIAESQSYDGQQLYFYDLQTSLAVGTPLSMGLSLAIAAAVLILTTWNFVISLYAMLSIVGAFCVTVGTLVLLDWRLNIFESAILTLAVGLSVDFTIHYGVAYRLAPSAKRVERTNYALETVGSAVTVAALSTFVAGAMMLPATVIAYVQLGTFLTLVMSISWVFATFFFLSICRVIGPQGNCATIRCPAKLCCCEGKSRSTIEIQNRQVTENSSTVPKQDWRETGKAENNGASNVIVLSAKTLSP